MHINPASKLPIWGMRSHKALERRRQRKEWGGSLARFPSGLLHLEVEGESLLAGWCILDCAQTDATMLGVDACVLAVVCKRMQQLPTMFGPAVHRGKGTTHNSL